MGKVKKVLAIVIITALMQTGCADDGAGLSSVNIQTAPVGNGAGQNNETNGGSGLSAARSNGTGASDVQSNGADGEQIQTASADFDREAMLAAYISTLESIYTDQIFPDGQHGYDGISEMSLNRFAIYDIDLDNREELIIQYITTITAGQATLIYDYDSASGTVRTEFTEFPFLTYYDNGVIQADWSHNQGLAGARDDFWPYTLYQYNPETDSYTMIRMVDGWSKSLAEKDYEGNPFPDEIDVDGDGFLYYVMTVGEYGINTLVDAEEYNQWRDSYLSGAKEADISFLELTEENIAAIQTGH